MKRFIVGCAFAVLLAGSAALAQEHHAPAAATEETHGEGGGHAASLDKWKWANFILLAGIAGYFIHKHGGGFFAARTAGIQRGIAEAKALREQAEARYTEIERRLAGLGAEIGQLRAQAHAEAAAERDRIRQETQRELAKIAAQAERDIGAASKAAQQELRSHAAALAVGLAERKIRQRLTRETDAALVASAAAELSKHMEARAS